MRTCGRSRVRVKVRWGDAEHTDLHFVITGPKGGHRAGFFVRLDDLLAELSGLGVWEQLGIPVKERGKDAGVPRSK